ncbi:MFS transporter [Paenibacillus larvae]|uniref:MFS transporter n=1 Tax=Paenibacillus larvae TaxID=1464 RepID=UPI002853F664|nr:MFS transporter [Paenibacillus larvae]MDR5599462.1 MFS transporter [Paenibacillus larvae]
MPTSRSAAASFFLALGILLIAANMRAPITAVGPLVGNIRSDLGISNSMMGLLTTLPILAFAFMSFLVPKLSRCLGTGLTLFFSLVVIGAGIAIRSIPFILSLYLGTLLLGIGIAVCNVLLPSVIKKEFPGHIGSMTGAYSVAMTVMAAIASGISIPMANLFGWRSYLFMALLLPVAGILAWLPDILIEKGFEASLGGSLLSLNQFVSMPVALVIPILAGKMKSQKLLVAITTSFSIAGFAGLWLSSLAVPLWAILLGIGQGASIGLALSFISMRAANTYQAAELSGMAQSVGYLLAAAGPISMGVLHDMTGTWGVSLLLLILLSVLQLLFGLGAGRNAVVTSALKTAVLKSRWGYKKSN